MVKQHEAKYQHGDNMIKVSVSFYANLPEGVARPKHAWDCGEAYLTTNRSRGIRCTDTFRFRSLEEVPQAIAKAMESQGVSLFKGERKGKKTPEVKDLTKY